MTQQQHSNMEYVEIKTEDGLYEHYQITQNTEETSDDLFNTKAQQVLFDDYGLEDSMFPEGSQDRKQRVTWLPKDCKLLIALYKEEFPYQGKCCGIKTRRSLFERITKRMRAKGSKFTVNQVESKWKNLKRSYISTRTESKSHPFQKDLCDLMNLEQQSQSGSKGLCKVHGQPPTDRVSCDAEERSESVSVGNESPALEDEDWSDTDEEEDTGTRRKEKKVGAPSIARELQKWRVEFAKERQANKEYRTAKLNAYEKRTSLLEKQIKQRQELLDALMGNQNKCGVMVPRTSF